MTTALTSAQISTAIADIQDAKSVSGVMNVINSFSATATGPGGIIYSGGVGGTPTSQLAPQLANQTGLNIIDNTPRGQLLTNEDVAAAINKQLGDIMSQKNPSLVESEVTSAVNNVLYGTVGDTTSQAASIWGQASVEYAGSLTGDVTVISVGQNAGGIMANLELPAIQSAGAVESVGGVALADLSSTATTALSQISAGFSSNTVNGIYQTTSGAYTFSAEALESLGLSAGMAQTGEALLSAGAQLIPTTTSAILTDAGISVASQTAADTAIATIADDALSLVAGTASLGVGVVANVLLSSTPANAGEDAVLAQMYSQTAAQLQAMAQQQGDTPATSNSLDLSFSNTGNNTYQLNVSQAANEAAAANTTNILFGGNSASLALNQGDNLVFAAGNSVAVSGGNGVSGTVYTVGNVTVNLGNYANLTLDGGASSTTNGVTVNLGTNATVADNSAGSTVTTGGSSDVQVGANDVTVNNTGTACIDGNNCNGNTFNSIGATVTSDAGSGVTVNGTGNTITVGNGGTLVVSGTGNDSTVGNSTTITDNGDVTGLQGFSSRNVEYVAEGGNLRVYDTTIDSLLLNTDFIPTGTIVITGKIIDVKAIDFF